MTSPNWSMRRPGRRLERVAPGIRGAGRGYRRTTDEALTRMMALIRSGLLNLDHIDVTTCPLDNANDAVTHAAENGVHHSSRMVVHRIPIRAGNRRTSRVR
jgi:hypothetical protein